MVIHPAIGLYCLSEFPSTWVTVSLSLFTTIDALLSSLAGCFLTPLWSWQILTLKSPLSGGLSIAFSTSLMFLPPFYPLSPFRTDMIFHLLYLDWQVPAPLPVYIIPHCLAHSWALFPPPSIAFVLPSHKSQVSCVSCLQDIILSKKQSCTLSKPASLIPSASFCLSYTNWFSMAF